MPTSVGASRLLPSSPRQWKKLIGLLIVTLLGSTSMMHFLWILDLLWQYCGITLAVLAIGLILWLFWITPAVVKQPYPQEMEEIEMTGAQPNLLEESGLESSRMRARKPRLDATAAFSANSQHNARMAKPRRPEPGELRKTAVKFYTLKLKPLDTPPAELPDIIKIAPDHAMVETWDGGWEPMPYSELAYWADWKEKSRQAEKEREVWWSDRHLRAEQQAQEEKEAEAKREAQLKKEAEAKKKAEAKKQAEAKKKAEAERKAEAKKEAEAREEAEAKEKEAIAKQKAEEDEAACIWQNALNEPFKKAPPFTQGTVAAATPHTAPVASLHAISDSASKKRRIDVLKDTPAITGAPIQQDGKASPLPVNEDPNPNEPGRPRGEEPTPQCFQDVPTKAGPEIEMEDNVPGLSTIRSTNATPGSNNSHSLGSKNLPEQGMETATQAGPEVNMDDVAPYPTTSPFGHAAKESSNGTAADEDSKKAPQPQDIVHRPIAAFDEDFDDDPKNPPRADAPEFMQLTASFSALFIEKQSSKIFRAWIEASAAARAPAGGIGKIQVPQLPSFGKQNVSSATTSTPLPKSAPSTTGKRPKKPESKAGKKPINSFSTKASTTAGANSAPPFVFKASTTSKNPETQNLSRDALPQPAKTSLEPFQQTSESEKDAQIARERAQIDAVSGDWNQRLPEGAPATAAGTVPKDAESKMDANAADGASNSKTAAPSWTDVAKPSQGLAGWFGLGLTNAPNAMFSFGATPGDGTDQQEASAPPSSNDLSASKPDLKEHASKLPPAETTPEPSQHHADQSAGQTPGGPAPAPTAQVGLRKPRRKPLNIFEIHAKSPKSLSAAIKKFLDKFEDPFDDLDAERAGLRLIKSTKFLDKCQSITKFINMLCDFAAPKGHWDEQRLSRTAAKDGGIMTASIFHKVHMKLETLSSRPGLSGNYNEPSVQAAWAAMKRLEDIWTHAGGFTSQSTIATQAPQQSQQPVSQVDTKKGKEKAAADGDSAMELDEKTMKDAQHNSVKATSPFSNSGLTLPSKPTPPRKDSMMDFQTDPKQSEQANATESQSERPEQPSKTEHDDDTEYFYGSTNEEASQASGRLDSVPPQKLPLPADSTMTDDVSGAGDGNMQQPSSVPAASAPVDTEMNSIPGATVATAQASAPTPTVNASQAQQTAPTASAADTQMTDSAANLAGTTQPSSSAPTVQSLATQQPLPLFVPPKRNRFAECKDKKSVVGILTKELSTSSIWMQAFSNLSHKDPPATWTSQAFLDNCKLIKELFEEIHDYVVRDGHWSLKIINYKDASDAGIDSAKSKRVYNELVVLNQDHGHNNSAIRGAYEAWWAVREAWRQKT